MADLLITTGHVVKRSATFAVLFTHSNPRVLLDRLLTSLGATDLTTDVHILSLMYDKNPSNIIKEKSIDTADMNAILHKRSVFLNQ